MHAQPRSLAGGVHGDFFKFPQILRADEHERRLAVINFVAFFAGGESEGHCSGEEVSRTGRKNRGKPPAAITKREVFFNDFFLVLGIQGEKAKVDFFFFQSAGRQDGQTATGQMSSRLVGVVIDNEFKKTACPVKAGEGHRQVAGPEQSHPCAVLL